MQFQDFSATPHRRWNPLKEEWVLVSPHRALRPWSGAIEKTNQQVKAEYDPNCYLCPGNKRSGAENDSSKVNPNYTDVFAFDNDFPAILESPEAECLEINQLNSIIQAQTTRGICRVICFSPRHDLTLAQMSVPAIRNVIDLWNNEYKILAALPFINHVMIFENKGEIMGCSNPHPHGQIWATESIPNIALKSCQAQEKYFSQNKTTLLNDYLKWEIEQNQRIICANQDWVALVPFWATWPYEAMILPRTVVTTIEQLSESQKDSWAAIIQDLTQRFDKLFQTSFPYSMGIYQQPTDNNPWSGFCLHQIFLPPLLRSASIKKFMVGFELCAESQRDITPEQAAQKLKEL